MCSPFHYYFRLILGPNLLLNSNKITQLFLFHPHGPSHPAVLQMAGEFIYIVSEGFTSHLGDRTLTVTVKTMVMTINDSSRCS